MRKKTKRMLKAALGYAARGWKVFPLDGKEPRIKRGFLAAVTDRAQIKGWWSKWPDADIGIACDSTEGPIVVDIDKPKDGELSAAKLLAKWGLPATMVVRTGGGGRHYYFDPPKRRTQIKRMLRPFGRGKQKRALDILGDGGYVVAPPSVHPITTKAYRLVSDGDECARLPRTVIAAIQKVRDLEARQEAKELPAVIHEGERNRWLTSIAGTLRRRGAKPDELFRLLCELNESRCRPALDPNEVATIAKSIGKKPSPEDAYHELNTQYAVVTAGPQQMRTEILWVPNPLAKGPERLSHEFGRMTVQAFHEKLAPEEPIEVKVNGRPKLVSVSKGWFEWPGRREYDKLVFKPGDTNLPPNEFNTWRGWLLGASSRGSCELFLDHLRHVVCGGNRDHYEWLLDWMADLFQNPQRPPNRSAAVLLRGRQGTGKTLVGAALKPLLGPHHVTVNSIEALLAKFNLLLERCLLLQVEEAFWGGERKLVGRLKDLVTGATIRIEPKFVNAYDVQNCLRILVTSNEQWVWPTELDDRRAAIFDVKDTYRTNRKYFRRLFEELNSGGYVRLLYELEERHIDEDRLINKLPTTKATHEQALHTLSQKPEEVWLIEWLERGTLPHDAEVDSDGRAHLWTALLYEDYKTRLPKHAREITAAEFGLFLSEHIPKLKDVEFLIGKRWLGTQAERRVLPSLADCRALYAQRGRATPRRWSKTTKQQWEVERL